MSDKRDYYEVLGVAKDADPKAIKSAYRKLAMKDHPDRNPGDSQAEKRFKEAAEAYEVLSDAEQRARYDRFGHQAFEGAGAGGHHGFSNIEDIFAAFGDIFGGGGGGGGGMFGDLFGGRGGGQRQARGRDLRLSMELTLEEVDEGVQRTIELKRREPCDSCSGTGGKNGAQPITCGTCGGRGQVMRRQGFFSMSAPCTDCSGSGQVQKDPCGDCSGKGLVPTKTDVEIQIPAGVEDGMRLRIGSEGDAGPQGAPRGDLYVDIHEKGHKIFQRSGPDVITEVPFSFGHLALGTSVEIPTLRGRVEMTIPKATQSGKVFRLRGQGLPQISPDGRSGPRGDQLVRVFVEIPKKLTSRQEELLREFEEIEDEKGGKKNFFERLVDYFN
ncbi:MAG: molecular chaperone DnaJ [Planctomycetes bacterium]|nr:molecular chaperone DnaJ [Planctomycetota bacterium]